MTTPGALRHRPSGKMFRQEGYSLEEVNTTTSNNFFNKWQPSKEDETYLLIDSFIRDLETRIPENSLDKRNFIKTIRNHLLKKESKELIRQLTSEKAYLPDFKELTEKVNQTIAAKDSTSFLSYLTDLSTSLALAKLNVIAPGLGAVLFLGNISAAAALNTLGNLTVNEGVPEGAKSLCEGKWGYYMKCFEGYITQGTDKWNINDPQFNTVIQQANTQTHSLGAWIHLTRNLDHSLMGNVLKKLLPQSASNTTVSCTESSSIWQGFEVTGLAKNLPDNVCLNLKNEFKAGAEELFQNSESLKWDWTVGGSIFAGLTGITLLFVCGVLTFYCCAKNDKCCDCSP